MKLKNNRKVREFRESLQRAKNGRIDESSHLKWVYSNNHTKWQGPWQVKDYATLLGLGGLHLLEGN